VAEAGWDPSLLNPILPIDVSVDHSIAVDYFGTPDALRLNMTREIERNSERYRLLKWATRSLRNVRVHPPGTGIMHTMNLERLATVVTHDEASGWAFPDTLIGTDSHTPMVNGIGVLAWGVGGLEAESVMFGMPVMLKIPEVVGVRMTGSLPEGTLATDLALAVTHRLRTLPLSGKFVEFFGPGVSTLSCGERAVVANMAPEYGASCGFFAVDERTLEYLRATGRPDTLIRVVEAYCRRQHLWCEPDAEPRYTEVVEIDLSSVEICLAGPRRPQDRLAPGGTAAAVRQLARGESAGSGGADRVVISRRDSGPDGAAGAISAGGADVGAGGNNRAAVASRGGTSALGDGSDTVDSGSRASLIGSRGSAIRRDGAVAIAAITSCTNTSDPRLVVAAGLLARKARALGLKPQP
jgi:aconitate hydratase